MLTEHGEYMRKLTKSLLTVSLAAMIAGAVGCGGNGSDAWKGTDFTNYGNVIAETNGGFVAETDNYVYFINGIGSSSSDNTFGTPIKGALVAADKKDATKAPQVVIPELIVSTDYDAGIYLFKEGDKVYAYYGTPNREKNSSGAVSSSEMTFTKTTLDGKNNTKLFTVSSHSTTYRMAQGEDGAVYIVYYDTENSAIMSYNAKTGKNTVIAKADAKNNDGENGEYLSLGEYKFLKDDVQVVYTMTVYTQEYVAEQEAQTDSYSRQTATYNYIYKYTAGQDPVCIKDGKATNTTYALKSSVGGYLFYTAKPLVGGENATKTYGVKLSAINDEKLIDYTDNVKDDMIVESFEEVYFYDSDAKKVIKTTLVKEPVAEKEAREVILKNDAISSLLAVDENYVYGYNSDGYIVAISRADGKTVRISERTASSSWYKPETAIIGDSAFMLYCDSSSEGNSYVFGANLNKLGNPEVDDSGDEDIYYLSADFFGVMPAADRAAVVSTKINAIESPLDLEEDANGKYFAESVKVARAAYDALDKDAKNNISSADVKKLENAERAILLADAYKKLEPVLDYENLTEEKKVALKADYEAAKKLVESYGSDYSTIADYVTNNLNYFYQEAGKVISA